MTENAQHNGNSNLEIAQSNQDLIITKGKRKKHAWIIAGLVCIIVVILVIVAIVISAIDGESHSEPITAERPPLSLEDIIYGRTIPTSFNATWISGKELMYRDYKGNLVLYDLELGNNGTKVLLTHTDPILALSGHFSLSADRNFLLVAHSLQKIYRYSFKAKYTIINLKTLARIELALSDDRQNFILAKWAPVGNAIAFVYENNIYYKPEVNSENVIQITNDNVHISNGITDWVYEEEIFHTNEAMWFSPDGTKLAYAKFDDQNTQIMVLPIYGEPSNPLFQYPRGQIIKYPKVGTPNPEVSLHYVDLTNLNVITSKKLDPPTQLANEGPILGTVTWVSQTQIASIWLNRVQNKASIITYSTIEPFAMETIKNIQQKHGWLDLLYPPLFSNDGSKLALILSQEQGNNGSYRHVTIFTNERNGDMEALTHGEFVVTELLKWKHDTNEIFYLATTEEDPAIQHLYSVKVDTKEVKCYSCGIRSKNNQSECLYNTVIFAPKADYFVLSCDGPEVPHIAIYDINKKLIKIWDDNKELEELTRKKRTPKTSRLTFEVEGGFQAQVILKFPPNMDTSGKTKYPLLVNVYAGPDSYLVTEKFSLSWESYLATSKNIIYAGIDGRGSGLKGDKMLFSNFRRLGTDEVFDQINVTKQLQETLPYIDATRTAIWGWSYGGYTSAMALVNDRDNVFKCGMSVAPVTDWTLYDSMYTERFMGLPTSEDNLIGYNQANLLTKSEGMRNKMYFLIHGTYDDNVHYQQSMLWAKVLEHNDILFRQLSYPDESHGLSSVRPHLYHSLEAFLDECFIPQK